MHKLFVLAVAALSAFAAQAQADYPTAPIRIINISSPGAGGDAIARLLAEKMTPIVKGTFVIDNRPGAGGAIAADAGAKAKPDGYTLRLRRLLSHVLLRRCGRTCRYDPVKDFDRSARSAPPRSCWSRRNDFPANNLKEFIALREEGARGIHYASWGDGSTGHFCGELLNQRAQIKTSHVPYKGVTADPERHATAGRSSSASSTWRPARRWSSRVGSRRIASCLDPQPEPARTCGSYVEDGVGLAGKSVVSPMWARLRARGTPKPIMDKLSAACAGRRHARREGQAARLRRHDRLRGGRQLSPAAARPAAVEGPRVARHQARDQVRTIVIDSSAMTGRRRLSSAAAACSKGAPSCLRGGPRARHRQGDRAPVRRARRPGGDARPRRGRGARSGGRRRRRVASALASAATSPA